MIIFFLFTQSRKDLEVLTFPIFREMHIEDKAGNVCKNNEESISLSLGKSYQFGLKTMDSFSSVYRAQYRLNRALFGLMRHTFKFILRR